jgi:AAA+ ATPase superfamily predicted ATPase
MPEIPIAVHFALPHTQQRCETTKEFLKKYGFSDEEIDLVWKYFGGKPIYLIKALENRENLRKFCEVMLEIRFGQILDGVYELKKKDVKSFQFRSESV